MARFRRDGFVGDDTLSLTPFYRQWLFSGAISCSGNIVITVYKLLETVGGSSPDPEIQTVTYAYNVSVFEKGNVFRYDNQHEDWLYPGHIDEHHCHEFDWPTNNELSNSPRWVGADNWPTLGEVIEETRRWHAENYNRLPDPLSFVGRDVLKRVR
jgi:hypothetical protein